MKQALEPSARRESGPAPFIPTDEALARSVVAGQSEAFATLYARYRDPLVCYLRSLLREREDAHDALQITMLNAFRALRTGPAPESFRPWLFRIAHNAAASLARGVTSHEAITENVAAPRSSADEVVAREQVGRLLDDLGGLSARRRRLLLMRAVQGLDYAEIGEELDMSPAAVRRAAHEARASLRETERGRSLACDEVSATLARGDGRRARSIALLTHLRTCASCRRLLPAGSVTRGPIAAVLTVVAAARVATAKALGLHGALGTAAGSAGSALGLKAATLMTAAVIAVGSTVAGRPDQSDHGRSSPAPSPPTHVDAAPPFATPQSGSIALTAERPVELDGPEVASPPVAGTAGEVTSDTEPDPTTPADVTPGGSSSDAGSSSSDDPASGDSSSAREDATLAEGESNPGSGGTPGTPPGQGDTPPGQQEGSPGPDGTPPGHGGTPPGQGGTPPGQSQTPPGQGGGTTPPGHGGTPPGQGGTPPGLDGNPPGQNGMPPGQEGVLPGQAGGQSSEGPTSGQAATPPGQGGTPPGQGQGQGATPPGQGGNPPGQGSGSKPGNGSGDNDS